MISRSELRRLLDQMAANLEGGARGRSWVVDHYADMIMGVITSPEGGAFVQQQGLPVNRMAERLMKLSTGPFDGDTFQLLQDAAEQLKDQQKAIDEVIGVPSRLEWGVARDGEVLFRCDGKRVAEEHAESAKGKVVKRTLSLWVDADSGDVVEPDLRTQLDKAESRLMQSRREVMNLRNQIRDVRYALRDNL